MITKSHELNKINLNQSPFILLYGKNEGFKDQAIKQILKNKTRISNYDEKEVTIADIPGLIEGAHKGTGLGIQFLKHIERCKSLLHMIDITNNDIKKSYDQVKTELKNYSTKLSKKKN